MHRLLFQFASGLVTKQFPSHSDAISIQFLLINDIESRQEGYPIYSRFGKHRFCQILKMQKVLNRVLVCCVQSVLYAFM